MFDLCPGFEDTQAMVCYLPGKLNGAASADCDDEVTISEGASATPETTSPHRSGSRRKLSGVQAARAVAALMVVLYHATRGLSLPQYLGYIPFGNSFGFGHAGVDFFFVLSGFIIMHAHAADIGKPDRLYAYLWRRATRIYPIYWVTSYTDPGEPGFSFPWILPARLAPSHMVHSLLLLPEAIEPLVGVCWTLRSEILFYIVFGAGHPRSAPVQAAYRYCSLARNDGTHRPRRLIPGQACWYQVSTLQFLDGGSPPS